MPIFWEFVLWSYLPGFFTMSYFINKKCGIDQYLVSFKDEFYIDMQIIYISIKNTIWLITMYWISINMHVLLVLSADWVFIYTKRPL